MYLTIKHIKNDKAPLTFCLRRESDEGSPVILTDPMTLSVENFDQLSLRDGLNWYLEESPSQHSRVDEIKSEAVVKTLRRWGSESFHLLFDRPDCQWYRECLDHPEQLHIRIESESPEILSWPWEALCDTGSANREQDRGSLFLGTWCSIERRVSTHNTQWRLQERPKYLRMLLIISRPFGDEDVDFHAVSRTLVDCSAPASPASYLCVMFSTSPGRSDSFPLSIVVCSWMVSRPMPCAKVVLRCFSPRRTAHLTAFRTGWCPSSTREFLKKDGFYRSL